MTEAEKFLEERGFVDLNDDDFLSVKNLDIYRIQDMWQIRYLYLQKFGFAIASTEAIQAIARLSPLLDIGAGCGYWTYELLKAGADCTAIDTQTGKYMMDSKNPSIAYWTNFWTKIRKVDASFAVKRNPNTNLLFCWPDYDVSWPTKALAASKCKYVAYVGEGSGGCTADDRFHEF